MSQSRKKLALKIYQRRCEVNNLRRLLANINTMAAKNVGTSILSEAASPHRYPAKPLHLLGNRRRR